MNIHRYWQDKNIEDEIIRQLTSELVVASTSDTIIGLLAPLTQKGFDTLNRIKGRSDKPYLVLLSNVQQANQCTDTLLTRPLKALTENCWPGPLTLIVNAKKSVPSFMRSKQGTIALRVPAHEGLQKIAKQMNGIFSTSANQTNKPVPLSMSDLDPEIAKHVALIIDDQQSIVSKPSTILDCTGKEIKIVREGAYSIDVLRNYISI